MVDSQREPVPFDAVFESEIASINKRREELRRLKMSARPDIALELETNSSGKALSTSDGTTPRRPTDKSEVVGLALSGGGVRSAAFCLGVLQALYKCHLIRKVDYLSTVSGGGYIGTSLTAGMTSNQGHFPFASYLSEDETPSLQHVRDYSNYLFPNGASDVLSNAAIYARGLAANFVLVLPFLLIAVVVTVWLHPLTRSHQLPSFGYFRFTAYFALFLLAVLIGWGIARSIPRFYAQVEAPTWWTKVFGTLVLLFVFVAFCQLQPPVLDAMFNQAPESSLRRLIAVVQGVIVALTPIAMAIAFVARKFGEVIKSALESERVRSQIVGYLAKASVYVAGAIVPLLLWVVYLQFSFWAMCDASHGCGSSPIPRWLWSSSDFLVGLLPAAWADSIKHAAEAFFPGKRAVIQLYSLVTVLCFAITYLLRPNANSLHRLYRDRLSKAFLFESPPKVPTVNGVQPSLAPLQFSLSDLSDKDAPYQLINTALNVQASKSVNRRGRNADFFLLSKLYVGSRATGYVPTTSMQAAMTDFDLGSAVAVSGAAVSSSMGAATIKPLTATLALLNIRLGYWLRNPKCVSVRSGWNRWTNFYFLAELLGLLNEKTKSVYLTDGGHIDNLGLYELLRRRCQVIVVVDAEADPQMAFGSFNVVERYALIDLGVRIDLPWQQIANESKKTGEEIDEKGDAPKHEGPHVAIGEISYPGGRNGILIYIKSSLTGDENDYIFHYKKRYGAFPHETTLDQFFTEEQFEAYRALGFHAAYRFFDRRDRFAFRDPRENPCIREYLAKLDRVFPHVAENDPCWPHEHSSFVGILDEELRKAAAATAAKSAAESCCADVAGAAGRIANAAELAAGVQRPSAS